MDGDLFPSTFQDHQRELCRLSEYIEEKRAMADGILKALGCTESELREKPCMLQCAYNANHFVPEDSFEHHQRVCQYVSMGTELERALDFLESTDSNYFRLKDTPGISVEPSVLKAVKIYVQRKNTSQPLDLSTPTIASSSSLEDTSDVPSNVVESSDPVLMIRYIKSWAKVPLSFQLFNTSLFHPVPLKGWMFNNLPEKHLYCNEVGGEVRFVEDILSCVYVTPTVTPNVLLERLRPLLKTGAERFVLNFWKFVNILKVQQDHQLQQRMVDELLPLPPVRSKDAPQEPESSTLVAEIQAIVNELKTTPTSPNHPSPASIPLPPDHMTHHMTTEERRVLYDYIVELSQQRLGLSKDYLNDPNLFRDDVAMVTKKKQVDSQEEGKSYLEVLKEMRDYRRRRQSYRAKNVHVTKKTTKQIFHDIIEARTKEMQLSLGMKEVERGGRESGRSVGGEYSDEEGYKSYSEQRRRRSRRSHSRSSDCSDKLKAGGSNLRKRSRSPPHKRKRSHSPKRKRSHSPTDGVSSDSHSKSHLHRSQKKSHAHSRSRSKDRSHVKKHKHKSKHSHL